MGGAHTSVRVCTCGSQRPVLGVVPQGLSTMVFFWQQWGRIGGGEGKGGRQGSSLEPGAHWLVLDWLVGKHQRSSCSPTPQCAPSGLTF